MKKLISIFFIAFAAYTAQAQMPSNIYDTLAHLQAIYNKKEAFIGKPFSVLLDSLKYNIVYFGTHGGIHSDKSKETSTGFFFINPESGEDFETMYIDVYWQPYLDHNYTSQLYSASSGLWSEPARQYYKNGIIDDIDVSDDIKKFSKDRLPQLKKYTPIESDAAITAQQKNILNNSNYINQPFSLLWNDLSIKPKTVHGNSCPVDGSRECNTTFFYATPDNLSVTYFRITWNEGIPKTETQQRQVSVIRDFTYPEEYAIYANKIIQTIEVNPDPYYIPPRWIVTSCVYKKVLVDGLYQWRYEITKQYCENGVLGTATDVSYSTTNMPIEYCGGSVESVAPSED